jgi:hypothetical protein
MLGVTLTYEHPDRQAYMNWEQSKVYANAQARCQGQRGRLCCVLAFAKHMVCWHSPSTWRVCPGFKPSLSHGHEGLLFF